MDGCGLAIMGGAIVFTLIGVATGNEFIGVIGLILGGIMLYGSRNS